MSEDKKDKKKKFGRVFENAAKGGYKQTSEEASNADKEKERGKKKKSWYQNLTN